MDHQTMGRRIADCRKKLGLSQEALGEQVGVSRQAISKWEADAAMPEIDKLIALSKLFRVSVGWLLGVEALPQQENQQLSEALLRKIEDVVRQYQPKKKLPPWGKALTVVCVLLLLWGGLWLRQEWISLRSQVSYLSSRLSSNNNSAILSQLDALEERIDSLSGAPERFSIANWSYQIEPDSEKAQAVVMLTAIPGFWQADYTAVLSVRREGQQVISQSCAWDGTALTARLILPLENGYEYWLTAKYADGTQEQVELPHSDARNLKASFTIDCTIALGNDRYDRQKNTLVLGGYEIHLRRPNMTSGYGVDWTEVELILYHTCGSDRRIVHTDHHLGPEQDNEQRPGNEIMEFWLYPKGPYPLPELQEGDGLELWVSAELSNGISLMQMVGSWAYLNSELLSGKPAQ